MAEQTPSPPQERPAAIAAVALKIPPFWPADPAVWLAQVEAQFSNRGVAQQWTNFDYVIAAFAPDMATEVRDLILHPPVEQPYDRLKETLIQRTKASEQRRHQQLLTAEELGDRNPSQLLRRMQQLLGNSGPAPDSAFVRQLFLQCLPPSVSIVLASSSATLPLTQLAEMADKILEVVNPTVVISVTDPNGSDMRQLTDTLTRLIAMLESSLGCVQGSQPGSHQSRSSSHSASRSSSRSTSPTSVCWYHRRFGPNARKCCPPLHPVGKRLGQPLVATSATGHPISRLIFLKDRTSSLSFLVYTGAEVSVLPPSCSLLCSTCCLCVVLASRRPHW